MKVTQDAALSLPNKYVEERTPVFAALVTPSVSVARVKGTIHIFIAPGPKTARSRRKPSTLCRRLPSISQRSVTHFACDVV